MKQWYVIQVVTGSEEIVKNDIISRIAESKIADHFGRVEIPEGNILGLSQDPDNKEKIFPGYLLIEMEMSAEARKIILSAARVLKFLGGVDPLPLSDKEVEHIFSQISGKIKIQNEGLDFSVGNEIRIISGPFEGFVGIVEEIDFEKEKLKVVVSIFGRMTSIELALDQVER